MDNRPSFPMNVRTLQGEHRAQQDTNCFNRASTMATELPRPKPKNPPKLVAIGCDLLEPFDQIWFRDGQPKEVVRISPWLQMQIDAGLMKVVE